MKAERSHIFLHKTELFLAGKYFEQNVQSPCIVCFTQRYVYIKQDHIFIFSDLYAVKIIKKICDPSGKYMASQYYPYMALDTL